MARKDASRKESFDIAELSSNGRAALRIVRSDFKCRVHKKAALALPVVDRMVDDLGEETLDGLLGRKRLLEP